MNIHSIEYFNSQVCEFHKQMGLKTFWANIPMVKAARKALFVLYTTADGTEEEQSRIQTTFLATMSEFTTRALMMNVLDQIA